MIAVADVEQNRQRSTGAKLAIGAGVAALFGCLNRSASQPGAAVGNGNQLR